MNFTTFSVSNLTDTDLANLAKACAQEQTRRGEARHARRVEWIHSHVWDFMKHPYATVHTCEKRTIVALYNRHDGVRIGTAYPVNGDVYDQNTGVAVAYAKAMGEHIPSYI